MGGLGGMGGMGGMGGKDFYYLRCHFSQGKRVEFCWKWL